MGTFTFFIIVFVIVMIIAFIAGTVKRAQMTPEQHQEFINTSQYGQNNNELICPHCQTKGHVRTKETKCKKGISGAKATGALLTGGLSILATGLSRKEENTQAHCTNCNSTWTF